MNSARLYHVLLNSSIRSQGLDQESVIKGHCSVPVNPMYKKIKEKGSVLHCFVLSVQLLTVRYVFARQAPPWGDFTSEEGRSQAQVGWLS